MAAIALFATASGCELIAGIHDITYSPDASDDSGDDTGGGFPDSTTPDTGGPVDGTTEGGSGMDASEGGGPDSRPDVSSGVDAPVETGPRDTGGRDAPLCTGDLSHIGTGDFVVSFTVKTMQAGRVALLNQRTTCGFTTYWDIRIWDGGVLLVQTNIGPEAQAPMSVFSSGTTINDGSPHAVEVLRQSGTITVSVDGMMEGTGASAASFGALPSLNRGTDPCAPSDGTVAFSMAMNASITNVCVGIP